MPAPASTRTRLCTPPTAGGSRSASPARWPLRTPSCCEGGWGAVTVGVGETAVVVGGSVAGSFAARVLADHFERVIVFDKDDLPDGAEPRKGAPQGVHFHA